MDNILFIHCPGYDNKIKLISYGVFGICDSLEKAGLNINIIHLGLEKKDFDLIGYIKKNNIKYICFSIQWYLQMKESLDLCKQIKNTFGDDVKIIVGGYSATYYEDDIYKLNIVDKVIAGEGSQIFEYLGITKEKIKEGNLLRFDLLNNYNDYLKINYYNEEDKRNIFYVNYGKGCTNNCAYCSGGAVNFERKLKQLRYYPIPKDFIENLVSGIIKFNLKVWYISFHDAKSEVFYIKCLEELSDRGIKLDVIFELFYIPKYEFLAKFSKLIGPGSKTILTVDSSSQEVRRMAKGKYYYNNEELLKFLNTSKELEIKIHCSFSIGLLGENFEDFKKTIKLIIYLKSTYNISTSVSFIEIEPGSLLDEKDLVKSRYKKFEDYLEKKLGVIGYDTENFTEEEIMKLYKIARAGVVCYRSFPLFYKKIIETNFEEFQNDFENIYSGCKACPNYDNCFNSKDLCDI